MGPENEAARRKLMAEIERDLAEVRRLHARARREKPPGDINIALTGNAVWTLERCLEDCRLSLAQSEAERAGDDARHLALIEEEEKLWAGTETGRQRAPLLEFHKALLRDDAREKGQAAAVLALEDPAAAAGVGLDPFAFVAAEGEG